MAAGRVESSHLDPGKEVERTHWEWQEQLKPLKPQSQFPMTSLLQQALSFQYVWSFMDLSCILDEIEMGPRLCKSWVYDHGCSCASIKII